MPNYPIPTQDTSFLLSPAFRQQVPGVTLLPTTYGGDDGRYVEGYDATTGQYRSYYVDPSGRVQGPRSNSAQNVYDQKTGTFGYNGPGWQPYESMGLTQSNTPGVSGWAPGAQAARAAGQPGAGMNADGSRPDMLPSGLGGLSAVMGRGLPVGPVQSGSVGTPGGRTPTMSTIPQPGSPTGILGFQGTPVNPGLAFGGPKAPIVQPQTGGSWSPIAPGTVRPAFTDSLNTAGAQPPPGYVPSPMTQQLMGLSDIVSGREQAAAQARPAGQLITGPLSGIMNRRR